MEVQEFIEETRRIERLWDHTLKDWERGDLRTMRRSVLKRGRVLQSDIVLLGYFGKPIHGYFINGWPPPRKAVKKRSQSTAQGSLF